MKNLISSIKNPKKNQNQRKIIFSQTRGLHLRFREYYLASIKQSKLDIFEQVFDKYYSKGFFGTINEHVIKKQQKCWFEKFLTILESKDTDEILTHLEDRQNTVTREWFSRLYEIDIVEKSKKEIEQVIKLKIK